MMVMVGECGLGSLCDRNGESWHRIAVDRISLLSYENLFVFAFPSAPFPFAQTDDCHLYCTLLFVADAHRRMTTALLIFWCA